MYPTAQKITWRTLCLIMLSSCFPLTALSHQTDNMPTVRIIDTVGGNENILSLPLPEDGDPLALPNPSVFQKHAAPYKEVTTKITLKPEEQTEIKLAMAAGQVAVYSWTTDQESVYVDFHGHQPDTEDFFVRYEELDEGKSSHGSLAAPFAGHHGWFLLNMTEHPVTVTFKFAGFFNEVIEYEITSSSPF